MNGHPPSSTLFPYPPLSRSCPACAHAAAMLAAYVPIPPPQNGASSRDTRQTLMKRSEEHTSELQSPDHLVCRLLLEKKNTSLLLTHDRTTPSTHTNTSSTRL